MTAAQAIIVDAARAGVLLYLAGDALRFKALGRMPADLSERIKASKAAVLALLRSSPDKSPDAQPDAADAPRGKPADLLGTLRDAMAPWTLEVVSVRPDPTWPRNRAARLIREARRRQGRDRAITLRDAFTERVAICTIDGGQDQRQAERIAVHEIESRCQSHFTLD